MTRRVLINEAPTKNAFWSVALSDPHAALAFDRLHTFHGGLFGRHLWPELQVIIEALGRGAMATVNELYAHNIP